MTGDETREINEYERANALGLSRWDLFPNLGIAFRVNGNLPAATDALRRAVQLDSEQPEPHYHLGLVCEQRSMLTQAEQEMLTTLRLEPERLDARNMLGVIYARQGKLKLPRSGVRCFGKRPATARPARTWRSSNAKQSMVTLELLHTQLRSRFADT